MTVEVAIDNNVALYGSIFRAHGLVGGVDEHYWSTDAEPPPYFSRLVTRTRGSRARKAQLNRLQELAERAEGRAWGFKDSFDDLPEPALAGLGLRALFHASWYACAGDAITLDSPSDFVVQQVASVEGVLSWEEAWRQSSPASQTRVFPDKVLADPSLELFAVGLDGRMAGGFILNRSEAAVGLSNVFQVEGAKLDAGAFLRECARQARRLHAGDTVVGFGPRSEVDGLASLGFVPLGPLAVWASA